MRGVVAVGVWLALVGGCVVLMGVTGIAYAGWLTLGERWLGSLWAAVYALPALAFGLLVLMWMGVWLRGRFRRP